MAGLNYTSRKEMESCFSVMGIDQRLDDEESDGEFVNDEEEGYLEDVGEEATDTVNQYLLVRYNANSLVNNRWVRRTTSWIACYILSMRRGNPKQFVAKYQEALIHLLAISEGHRPIFDENGNPVPVSSDLAPAHSNLAVDDRWVRRKLRVQRETSSGGQSGKQDPDWPAFWR